MKINSCVSIQESIAAGDPVSPEEQGHIESCQDCGALQNEYRNLEKLFALDIESTRIPSHFADSVMIRIENETKPFFGIFQWPRSGEVRRLAFGADGSRSFVAPITRLVLFITTLFLFTTAR